MSVYEKLMQVQQSVSVPKNRTNSFGKYSYRSAEDICEGVKPVLGKVKASIILTDSIENIGDRFYVKATAIFIDSESGEKIENTGYARESAEKKGMDDSQISGTASSYARKYALNGLLLLDDNKDADTDENHIEREARMKRNPDARKEPDYITEKEKAILRKMLEDKGYKEQEVFPKGLNLTSEQYTKAVQTITGMKNKK